MSINNGESNSNSNNGINYDDMSREDLITMLKTKDEMIEARKKEEYKGSIEEMLDEFAGIPDMPQVQGLQPHEDNSRCMRKPLAIQCKGRRPAGHQFNRRREQNE